MRKILFSFICAIFSLFAISQTVTVNVPTAGTFSTALVTAGGNAGTVTNLTVTGNIDIRDIKYMRDNMPSLSILNLGGVQIKSYTDIDDNVFLENEMPSGSFENRTSISSIVLPSTLTTIGYYAFSGCTGLTGVLNLPNSLNVIKAEAFMNCAGFTGNLIIPSLVNEIG